MSKIKLYHYTRNKQLWITSECSKSGGIKQGLYNEHADLWSNEFITLFTQPIPFDVSEIRLKYSTEAIREYAPMAWVPGLWYEHIVELDLAATHYTYSIAELLLITSNLYDVWHTNDTMANYKAWNDKISLISRNRGYSGTDLNVLADFVGRINTKTYLEWIKMSTDKHLKIDHATLGGGVPHVLLAARGLRVKSSTLININ